MDFCAETNEVSKRKTACREALEQPIECDITLPEYLPDIQRVLKCSLTAHISSVQKTGDRVTADGTGRLSVLYMSDTGKLQCLEQGVPFSRFFENRAVEECECCVRAKTFHAIRASEKNLFAVAAAEGSKPKSKRMKCAICSAVRKRASPSAKYTKSEMQSRRYRR